MDERHPESRSKPRVFPPPDTPAFFVGLINLVESFIANGISAASQPAIYGGQFVVIFLAQIMNIAGAWQIFLAAMRPDWHL